MKKKIEAEVPPVDIWQDRNSLYMRGKSGVSVWSNHNGAVVLQVNVVNGLDCDEHLVVLTPDNAVDVALALSTAASEGQERMTEVSRLHKK